MRNARNRVADGTVISTFMPTHLEVRTGQAEYGLPEFAASVDPGVTACAAFRPGTSWTMVVDYGTTVL
jgi:hypothetical protein